MKFPDHYGAEFTKTIHTKAEGPTDPKNNRVSDPFVVLITGAGKGLGYHVALAYAKAGASGVCISSRTRADINELKEKLEETNPKLKVLARVCDTTEEDDVERLASQVQTEFGRLDVVVANAGIISKYLEDDDGSNRRLPTGIMEDLDFSRVIDINLSGTARVARIFLPQLISTHDGPQAFVVITSMASQVTRSNFTPMAYNISKIAVNRLVEHLHNDLNDTNGIQAFAVHPGAVVTPQTQGHSREEGDDWDTLLTDDIGMCGGFLTWLTKERRDWLSGRYICANWDVDELEEKRQEIMDGDKLKFRMAV